MQSPYHQNHIKWKNSIAFLLKYNIIPIWNDTLMLLGYYMGWKKIYDKVTTVQHMEAIFAL